MKFTNLRYNVLSMKIMTLFLLVSLSPVCFASGLSDGASDDLIVEHLSSLEELQAWYRTSNLGDKGYALLDNDIIIDQAVTMAETDEIMNLDVGNSSIHITSGGALTLDNSSLWMIGDDNLIILEKGGTLNLHRGNMDAGDEPILRMAPEESKPAGDEFYFKEKIWDKEVPTLPTEPVILCSVGNTLEEFPHMAVRPGMSLAEIPKLEKTYLWPVDSIGSWSKLKIMALHWSEEDFQRGIDSGEDSFLITATYGPELLSKEDQLLWNNNLFIVEPQSQKYIAQVNVVHQSEMPFSVQLIPWDDDEGGFYPAFTIPMPYNATSVLFEASTDGQTWCQKYAYDDQFQEKFYDKGYLFRMKMMDDDFYPLLRMQEDQVNYFRVTVEGSIYDGMSGTLILDKVLSGGDSSTGGEVTDDKGGNRGGGGQGEVERLQLSGKIAQMNELQKLGDDMNELIWQTYSVIESMMALPLPTVIFQNSPYTSSQPTNELESNPMEEPIPPREDASQMKVPILSSDRTVRDPFTPSSNNHLVNIPALEASTPNLIRENTANVSDDSANFDKNSVTIRKEKDPIHGFAAAAIGTGILLLGGTALFQMKMKKRGK